MTSNIWAGFRFCLSVITLVCGASWGSSAGQPSISVSPSTTSVRAGAAKQFSVRLNGANGPVTWSVNGAVGGAEAVGTVSPTGLFTAPNRDPGGVLKVGAAVPTPALSANASVTWLNPVPGITSLVPSSVNVGTFSVTVNGRGFVPNSRVMLNGQPIAATIVSSSMITFQATITSAGGYSLVVVNPEPGAASSGARTLTVMEPIRVSVSPAQENVRLGSTRKYYARLYNAVDKRVAWAVNGVEGGSPALGTIASDGAYSAPLAMPPGGMVTISATSLADPRASSEAIAQLLNPIPVIEAIVPTYLTYGTYPVTIKGSGFVDGSYLRLGDKVFVTKYRSPTELVATVTLEPNPAGFLAFRVRNPDPGSAQSGIYIARVGPANPVVSHFAAARFLEQASWGPDAASIARVQEIGFEAWIDEQMLAPLSLYKSTTDASDNLVKQQSQFFVSATRNADQLRQRVAFALGQIFVVSGLKTGQPRQMVPYQNLLLQDAFGPYRALLRDVTLSPTMGVYLDMVNNDRAEPGSGLSPNENYGREVMQLFSIGTILLNSDGSAVVDSVGRTTPTYDQFLINEMARALTGWTFPGRALLKGHNRENYAGPMIPVEANHDREAKTILGGVTLPAGQTATQDLDAVVDAIANHPNVAPFIVLRLIQHLVVSNPSPDYVARMSQVFNSTQGNLGAVVRAILLDPEARRGDDSQAVASSTGGHLREPILYLLNLIRTFNARVPDQNPIESLAANMGQKLFYSPSVFNYYSPLYKIPGGLSGPEFQILSSSTALVRANAVQSFVARGLDGDARVDLGPFTALASAPAYLVDAVDHALLFERMPPELKAAIVTAISATNDPVQRVRNAIYLTATSAFYQVEH